ANETVAWRGPIKCSTKISPGAFCRLTSVLQATTPIFPRRAGGRAAGLILSTGRLRLLRARTVWFLSQETSKISVIVELILSIHGRRNDHHPTHAHPPDHRRRHRGL